MHKNWWSTNNDDFTLYNPHLQNISSLNLHLLIQNISSLKVSPHSKCFHVTGFIFSEVCPLYVHFSFLAFILYCCLRLTMFEFTGQCYGHWVNKSYCPWVIEPYVVVLVLVR